MCNVYEWNKYNFPIYRTLPRAIFHCLCRTDGLLWLDTDGISVVISNIPHVVTIYLARLWLPSRNYFKALLSAAFLCVSVQIRLIQASTKSQGYLLHHNMLILLYGQLAQHETSRVWSKALTGRSVRTRISIAASLRRHPHKRSQILSCVLKLTARRWWCSNVVLFFLHLGKLENPQVVQTAVVFYCTHFSCVILILHLYRVVQYGPTLRKPLAQFIREIHSSWSEKQPLKWCVAWK